MKVAGLVLAAGGSSRLGRPKAEVRVGGRRLVDRAVDACVRAGLGPVVVVLGAVWLTPMLLSDDVDADEINGWDSSDTGHGADGADGADGSDTAHVGDGADASSAEIWLVENTDWATGMASSLRAGLAVLEDDPGIGGVVVTLVDTPSVGAEHLRRIGATLRDGATAAVATYGGTARTPAGLTREVWAEVAASAAADEGARGWLRAHPQLVTGVECADLGPWTDIDTPDDLPD